MTKVTCPEPGSQMTTGSVTAPMTEPTPRTDDPETGYRSHYAEHEHNQELCRTLERQCARQSALLRDILNDPRVLPEWIGELIKRELEGKS